MVTIGICGGSGSGKSTICHKFKRHFKSKNIVILNQDSYYKDNSHIDLEKRKKINFDHPDAIEFSLLEEHINFLKHGIPIEKPGYSFITCTRTKEKTRIAPPDILLVEGILVFFPQKIRELFDIKVFVDAEKATMLKRVIKRDKTLGDERTENQKTDI